MKYTYGLPRRFLWALHDQSINPMRYKILIRMDDELLFVTSLFDNTSFQSKYDTPSIALFVMDYDRLI